MGKCRGTLPGRDNVLRQQVRQVLDLNAVLHASNNAESMDQVCRYVWTYERERERENNYHRQAILKERESAIISFWVSSNIDYSFCKN